jgi:Cdc6-like AAA superfamily ATPase
MKTPKIGGWDPKQIEGTLVVPDDFNREYKEEPKAYYSENMYDWLVKNPNKMPQQQQQQQQTKDYYEKGGIVRVKATGEYRRITGKTKSGKIKTEPVDIDDVIAKKKAELGYSLKREK